MIVTDIRKDTAIVLRTVPYSETSLILTLFSAKHGRVSLMAKGARRRHKNGSALAIEPGYELEVVWSAKSSREVQLARELALVNSHWGMRKSLESMVLCSAVIELLLQTTSEDDPHPELYKAAEICLQQFEASRSPNWTTFWKFYLVLLNQLGFAVNDRVIESGVPFSLSVESTAVLKKVSSSGFDVASRIRTSIRAESEIFHWLTKYASEHLPVVVHSRSISALKWVRPS